MQLIFGIILLADLATSTPTLHADKTDNISRVFPDCSTNYTSQHDIFSLTLHITKNGPHINLEEDIMKPHMKLFFVEADVKDNGEKDYKGLYVVIDNEATKLLDHGTDVATSIDSTAAVYFSAKDGLYIYNETERRADRYGNITDSVIGIEKVNGSDTIYILTEDHDLYKVINRGHEKIKIPEVNNAEKIVLDFSNNLFFYGPDKEPYVMNANGVTKIEGLPQNPTRVDMFRPTLAFADGVLFISDDKTDLIRSNGTVSTDPFIKGFRFRVVPTSAAMEGTLLQYYAYDKKICLYNSLQVWTRKISWYIMKNWTGRQLSAKDFDDFFNSMVEF